MIYKAESIIIKTRDFSEADKIVVLLSKKDGRIDAIAKGARKSTSRKTALIDLSVYADFRLATGKTFDVITEVKLINSFENIKLSLESAAIVYYMLDVTEKFFTHPEQGNEIFDDLLRALELINEAKELEKKLKTAYFYMIKLLEKTGFSNVFSEKGQQPTRLLKIINFVSKSNWLDCRKLKLNKKDLEDLDLYLHNELINIIQKRIKSYEFMKIVINHY